MNLFLKSAAMFLVVSLCGSLTGFLVVYPFLLRAWADHVKP